MEGDNQSGTTEMDMGYPSLRREVLYILSDAEAVINRYFLKAANMAHRALQANGTQAQGNIQQLAKEGGMRFRDHS